MNKSLLKKAFPAILLCLGLMMTLTGTAFAGVDGKGWIDDPNDKVVTYFGLGLVLFFTIVIVIGSWIQDSMNRRKDERR